MNIKELQEVVDAELIAGNINRKDVEIKCFCCTELMSDVLAFTHEGCETVLITALSNIQTLRTAEMVDIKVVVIVRGKNIEPKLIEIAEDDDIVLLKTQDTMFEIISRLSKYLEAKEKESLNE